MRISGTSGDPTLYVVKKSLTAFHLEDERADACLLRTLITELPGYSVSLHQFSDGPALLAALDARPPQTVPYLLLLDLHVPGFSGLEVLAVLEQRSYCNWLVCHLLTGDEFLSGELVAHRPALRGVYFKPVELSGWDHLLTEIFEDFLGHQLSLRCP
ncbi:MAG: hypothetical protein OHK0039_13590 [Bacteroidia bacterium]